MNLPTKITISRILLIPIFVLFFFLEIKGINRFIALGIFVVASLTDWVDGYLARKNNMVTNLGIFLDNIADKMLVSCGLFAVMTDLHVLSLGVVICAMVIICREFLISALRQLAAMKNVALMADKLGKAKTFLQMTSLFFLIPLSNIVLLSSLVGDIVLYTGFSLLALSTLFALISAINYLVKCKSVFAAKSEKEENE